MTKNGLSRLKTVMKEIDTDVDIQLRSYLGSDSDICAAARVSHIGTESERPEDPVRDTKLIRYLYDNRHTSPFEHIRFQFRISCPIFVARQWMRHRTGSFNEVSGRYTELKPLFWLPTALRTQDAKDKQASDGVLHTSTGQINMEDAYSDAWDTYQKLLSMGVAREMARAVLPLGIFTEYYWSTDLHNLFHFIELRQTEHAQPEIAVYADRILELIEPIVPIAVDAFKRRGTD